MDQALSVICPFSEFNNCGYVDRSISGNARWILKSQASLTNGEIEDISQTLSLLCAVLSHDLWQYIAGNKLKIK